MRQRMTPVVRSAFDVLRIANMSGEVGYVPGGDEEHLPMLRDAERNGWIMFDRYVPAHGIYEIPARSIFRITQKGREEFRNAMDPRGRPLKDEEGQHAQAQAAVA